MKLNVPFYFVDWCVFSINLKILTTMGCCKSTNNLVVLERQEGDKTKLGKYLWYDPMCLRKRVK
jgi:hypothetical protein